MANSGIITGQYVRIQPTVASIGDRIFAQIIDWVVILAYLTVLTLFASAINFNGSAWLFALYILPPLFFTVLCEILNQGHWERW